MRIALLQMAPAWEEPERNHSVARSLISEAARNNSDIAVLPEMFSTGFSFELQGLERPNESSTHSFLSSVAKEFEVNLIAGFKALSSDSEKGLNIARAYSRKGKVHST
ncbi:MAG: hypothetical protein GWN61_23180, partial [candidate division Zixibacteria bacterium]|nr:hypothetical protein [Gammaproteobacteria bacterium]NIV08997.1 hypothetical protein [candidate division Zixibacteria bacterium]